LDKYADFHDVYIPANQPGLISVGEPVKAQYVNPVAHPLGPPTISTTTMTVDTALQTPTRITRTLMDLSLQRFFADRVFASGGGVTGGAVIYDPLIANDLYLARDIERVAPGAEFPIVTSLRRAPSVALPEKWGGKFFILKEARDRNETSVFARQVVQLSNTLVRKINQRSVEVLDAAVAAGSRTIAGVNWQTVVTTGSSASNATLWPARDFAKVQQQAEVEELGIVYDLAIMNPQEYFQLATIYGAALNDLLNSLGFDIFVTNRVTSGSFYVVAQGQVGEMRIESPLMTETWYEEATQRFWTQTSVRPLWFVDNQFAVLKVTGVGP
jgi:hypothetical protein